MRLFHFFLFMASTFCFGGTYHISDRADVEVCFEGDSEDYFSCFKIIDGEYFITERALEDIQQKPDVTINVDFEIVDPDEYRSLVAGLDFGEGDTGNRSGNGNGSGNAAGNGSNNGSGNVVVIGSGNTVIIGSGGNDRRKPAKPKQPCPCDGGA